MVVTSGSAGPLFCFFMATDFAVLVSFRTFRFLISMVRWFLLRADHCLYSFKSDQVNVLKIFCHFLAATRVGPGHFFKYIIYDKIKDISFFSLFVAVPGTQEVVLQKTCKLFESFQQCALLKFVDSKHSLLQFRASP